MKILQTKKFGVITITDKQNLPDGSTKLSYALDEDALQKCAEELNKEVKDLQEPEIHAFTMKAIGSALKGHDGWKSIKKS